MSTQKITRRKLLKGAGLATAGAGAAFMGPWKHNHVYAAATDKPIKIGLTSDASGQYANSGASDRRGMHMAIAEFNAKGGVLGRKVETIHIDTETTPATGSRVAERLITRENCSFLIGAVSSGVANAISQVAQKYGCVYLNTNSSSPTESGKNAHRVKFVWDGNGNNFAHAAYPDTKMKVPGNVFYNGYMATRELLSAVERNGSTNNVGVIKQLEQLKISARDHMQHHDAWMNPKTHQMQQTVYLATANTGTLDKDDMFKILSNSSPEEVRDHGAEAAAKLESYADTPTYEI